jgi:hypothetical protein
MKDRLSEQAIKTPSFDPTQCHWLYRSSLIAFYPATMDVTP